MNPKTFHARSLEWVGGADGFLRLIDQTRLPIRLEYRDCHSVEEVWEAIRTLRVRGAPAIGGAAGYGVVLGMQHCTDRTRGAFAHRLNEVASYLRTSRPTAVNLSWAVERMERCLRGRTEELPALQLVQSLLDEARAIEDEDRRMCRTIGEVGAALIGERCRG